MKILSICSYSCTGGFQTSTDPLMVALLNNSGYATTECNAEMFLANTKCTRKYILCYNIDYIILYQNIIYEGWNFNSGNYLFTTDTK